jgi:pyruvate dehydrogenase E2 component (dihydrolipoamide acetyltransferase)
VETDKAVMDLEAFESGYLLKIVAPEGTEVGVQAPVAVLGGKDEKFDESILKAAAPVAAAAPAASAPAPVAAAPAPAPIPQPATPAPKSDSRVKASPLAKKVAAELGVSLQGLAGTGPGGRIVKKDVLTAPKGGAGGGWGIFGSGPIQDEKKVPLTNMRRVIATRLVESKQQIPHFYLSVEVDCDALVALRMQLNGSFEKLPKPFKLSFNDFVLKATAEAIRRVPAINASFTPDGVIQYANVQLAFGVAIPDGLITPIIKEAQNKNLKQIADEAKALAVKAKDGKLQPAEFMGGTFTVSNLGMFGIDSFSAIVNPPQAAILAVANIVKKPVVNAQDQIVIGNRMNLTLSCDHRVVDGAVAATFLSTLRGLLESPAQLLI